MLITKITPVRITVDGSDLAGECLLSFGHGQQQLRHASLGSRLTRLSGFFFQDFLLGPFLQRRSSLAEQLGWLHSINVVETECVKAGA
jgi:hypothetical protein